VIVAAVAAVAALVLAAIFLVEATTGKRAAGPGRGPAGAITTTPETGPASPGSNVFQAPIPAIAAGLTPHPFTQGSSGATTIRAPGTTSPQIVHRSAPPITAPADTTPPNTLAPVVFSLAGSCTASAPNFSCRLSLRSSNGLASGGYVSVFPSLSNTQLCRSSGALVHDSVSLTGTCAVPFASLILAVYSLAPDADPSRLASAYIPWSRS
jgi:hypothetical protein